jgi:hypothetical protein
MRSSAPDDVEGFANAVFCDSGYRRQNVRTPEAAECGDKPSGHPEQLIAQVEPPGQK